MSKEMQFSLYMSFIVIPFLVTSVVVSGIGLQLGEMIPPSVGAARQYHADTMIVYRPDWRKRDALELKWQAIKLRDPQVMVIGSSLGFMFRSEFFDEPDAFYNASVEGMSPQEVAIMLDKMGDDGIQPRVILLNLDFHRFLPTGPINAWEEDYHPLSYMYNQFRISVRRWLFDPALLRGNLASYESRDVTYQGLIAINRQLGYRNDGSYFMGQIAVRREARLDINYRQLDNQTRIYRTGTADMSTLDLYRAILERAAANDITVIGYFSPLHTDVLDAFEAPGYAYIDDVKIALCDLFAMYEMPCYDFMRAADIGGSDSELYDLRHSGEVLSLRMLQAMVADYPELFTPFTTGTHITQLLDNAATDLLVFEPPE